ncbi:UPF0146 family protein [Halobacteria archaeon AArc-curdl1]|uniref:UPF0146 protein OB919_07770 n=1 Tax=Natronosalvus hydrolyticus TaxID=2979988 RepID=A0AAP2Z9H4_9EURY|nr:UPF0146 family protein [Halobacteria archaeon AArc-curdl1]
MAHSRRNTAALVDALSSVNRLVEIGIGRRTDVAKGLAERGCQVVATDIIPRDVPDAVTFIEDDVLEPTLEVYADADTLYALNLPPELHRPAWELARAVDAEFRFTTLGGDSPMVPVRRVSLPRETLFVAEAGVGDSR